MKTGTSNLNPYATSYIPLSKRAAVGETKDFKAEESKTGSEGAWGSEPDIYNVPSLDTLQAADSPKMKGHLVYGKYGSSSHHGFDLKEKQIADEEFEMDMAYLQMTFPGISDESLSHVYLLNQGDLEAAIDMLNQLELNPDFSEKLPDTLDIGDVSEPGCSTESASQKLKKVTGEAVASSSRTLS